MPQRFTYDCASNHSIFLRSNGSIACWCDAGCTKFLINHSHGIDYGKDVYLGKIFQNIRAKLKEGEFPFPEFCKSCGSLEINKDFDNKYFEKKIINTFQVEPSSDCNLNCSSCASKERRNYRLPKTEFGHLILNINVFKKILSDLMRNNIEILKFDFQGHGEPLLNKNIWEMISLARSLYENAIISVCTNANVDYKSYMVDSGLSEIVFAIDGINQETYVPYRRNGDFKKALKFLNCFCYDVCKFRKNIKTIWKYVIFDHNDSNENLIQAQLLANEAGIDEIKFIITSIGKPSKRITCADHIPILDNGVKVKIEYFGISRKKLLNNINIYLKNNKQDTINEHFLHIASRCSYEDIVLYLIENGFDVNAKNTRGATPLHVAVRCENISIVEILLKNGANVNEKNNINETVFDIANLKNNKIICRSDMD